MSNRPLVLVLSCSLAATAAAGCGQAVPDQPTWFADVQPLVMANCSRCHGPIPAEPRVAGVRLDRYVAGDDATLDAWDYRDAIVLHAVDREAPAMPPTYQLSERQRDLLDAWVATGAPKGTRTNQEPTAEVADGALPATADQSLAFWLRTADGDGDGLLVSLGVRDTSTGVRQPLPGGLVQGLAEVTVDTGQVASGGAVELYAVVDDGFSDDPVANHHEIVLGTVTIDHGARGTAPTVTVLAPNGGDTILGMTTITWTASDPDPGDTLTIDVDLVRVATDGSTQVAASIASGLVGVSSYPWDPDGVPIEDAAGPIPYAIRVTATDAGGLNTRFDDSDVPFTIAPPPVVTQLTWADVKPTFVTYCASKCHGDRARTVVIDYFRLDKYDATDPEPPVDNDLGAYEQRSLIYNRLVVQGTMPPATEADPPAAEVDRIAEWILGGAPHGGGSGDGVPSFTWITPNNTTITNASTGTVTLAWTASDPEGMPLTGAIAWVYPTPQPFADQTAQCDPNLTGWADLPADVESGTYTWDLPQQGYFCLRGTVTDAAMQTTSRVATRPVKYKTLPGP